MRRRRVLATLGLAAAAATAATVLPAHPASAHPLGNLTQNTYAGIIVGPEHTTVDYILDLAELPTIQAKQRIDADGDGQLSPAEDAAYRDAECAALGSHLRLTVGSTTAHLTPAHGLLRFLPGQGGLQTLRLECTLAASAEVRSKSRVRFEDRNLTDRIGWREITLIGDGVALASSDVASATISDRLLAYPKGYGAPPRELSAGATVRPGGPHLGATATGNTSAASPARPQARGADPLTEWFQRTVGDRNLTFGLGLVALLAALVLGSFHAMAPGHGKTMMAAYVVGRRGTTRQVLAIGLTVALTHTGGVLALGTLIWLSQAIAPDRLLPWLTVASGSMLAACGLALLYRRVVLGRAGHSHLRVPGLPTHDHDHSDGAHHVHPHPNGHAHAPGHDHPHPHDHDHPHEHGHEHPHPHAHPHEHDHEHPHLHAHEPEPPPFRKAWLVVMGIAGGLVPTPSALVVLLGAMALHRTWFGVVLVALYGVGMAAALMSAGLILVRIQGWLERTWYRRPRAALLLRYLPSITALLLVGGGLSVIVRGAAQL
jgi:ABC-type nickel/cobalt efflux system permease component RcnA